MSPALSGGGRYHLLLRLPIDPVGRGDHVTGVVLT